MGNQLTCKAEGCNKTGRLNPKTGTRYFTVGFCRTHYNRFKKHGDPFAKPFGYSKHPLYSTYNGMKGRCLNQKDDHFHWYGGRGIKVCDRWLGINGFPNFVADMGAKPTSKHTLDRINNNGNYEPSNCRWATAHQQNANTRNSKEGKPIGVYFMKRDSKWDAGIMINKKYIFLGRYATMEEAATKRKEAEIAYGITI